MKFLQNLLSVVFIGVSPLYAAGSHDPDWPCVQRRVDTLSAAVMWPYQPESQGAKEKPAAVTAELAQLLALRRIGLDEAEKAIDAAANGTPALDRDDYNAIFADVFERLNQRRSLLMTGITRYARNQARLADEIDTMRSEIARMTAAQDPDFDRIDQIEADLDWRERVFHDRALSLTYACETPVLLEKRLYAIAQMLAARIDD
ncbi:MAG: hypothetical protein PF480_00810 [Roseovarius sp.]|jgi:hypothetical protein|nr:hypothetical protein [Roseovarius sp.]